MGRYYKLFYYKDCQMIKLHEITSRAELELVVAFFDLTRFARFSRKLSPNDYFDFISRYYEFVGDIVEKNQGVVIKFMGDSGLVVYPDDKSDQAVRQLKELKDKGDKWCQLQGAECRHIIKAHVGPVICGNVGTRRTKRLDVFGNTVMTAAVLESKGFAITPQLFRKLNNDTRKLFKKHTPPVTYIPLEDRH